ncbi:MAG: elongation factor G, partial [Candidatus Aminicenantes bacterium]|nr:elongation factor G [Candidatus Aminicenantes bacterium]
DGAILVLCSVGGVQSQSYTVDRQLKRYKVPNLAFINKCDRIGANPYKVKDQLVEELGRNAVLMQIPIGLEAKHEGVVDLIQMKALYFDGPSGEIVRVEDIPSDSQDEAESKREEMLEAVSMFSEELMEAIFEERVTDELIIDAVRRGTISNSLTPVFMGSAYRNKGIQPLLDAVVKYLPDPSEIENFAIDLDHGEKEVKLLADPDADSVALAFKLEEGQYGQLTYIRVYQGSLEKGDVLTNTRSQKNLKVGRLIRMHADSMKDIEGAGPGDIVALFGIDCASGDTFVKPGLNYTMSSIYVPDPVISLALTPVDSKASDNMAKALQRFTKEDPTFRTHVDPELNQTLIQGMGELHLDVYVERMKREYSVEVETGAPQVAYRETIGQRAEFDYIHRKQTGGAGQFGRVIGFIEPMDQGNYEFVDGVKGGNIPREFIPACDRGFQAVLKKGSLIGFPVVGVRVTLVDGQAHSVDSSEVAFRTASKEAFKQAYRKAKPHILEPIMRVSVEGPSEFAGNIFASINQRRGIIVSSVEDGTFARVDAKVPLSEMFGYSTTLRSLTQGKAEFTMEFLKYGKVPANISEDLMAKVDEKKR